LRFKYLMTDNYIKSEIIKSEILYDLVDADNKIQNISQNRFKTSVEMDQCTKMQNYKGFLIGKASAIQKSWMNFLSKVEDGSIKNVDTLKQLIDNKKRSSNKASLFSI
jgi:hypothetical protein